MVNYISGLVFAILVAVGAAVVAPLLPGHQMLALAVGGPWLIGAAVLSSAIRLAAEWERAVVFRLGRFREVKGPGLFLIIPLVEQLRMVDTRVQGREAIIARPRGRGFGWSSRGVLRQSSRHQAGHRGLTSLRNRASCALKEEQIMVRSTLALTALLSVASTSLAGDLVTPPVFVGSSSSVSCRLVDITTAPVPIGDIQVRAADGTLLFDTGPITLNPGATGSITVNDPGQLVYCRFVKASKSKVRATLTINPHTGDFSDTTTAVAQ
jgi:hypothetical protein